VPLSQGTVEGSLRPGHWEGSVVRRLSGRNCIGPRWAIGSVSNLGTRITCLERNTPLSGAWSARYVCGGISICETSQHCWRTVPQLTKVKMSFGSEGGHRIQLTGATCRKYGRNHCEDQQ
jgi:hypothetical protein